MCLDQFNLICRMWIATRIEHGSDKPLPPEQRRRDPPSPDFMLKIRNFAIQIHTPQGQAPDARP